MNEVDVIKLEVAKSIDSTLHDCRKKLVASADVDKTIWSYIRIIDSMERMNLRANCKL